MNKHPSRNPSARSFVCKTVPVLVMSAVCGLYAGTAGAQAAGGVTVNDPSALAKLIAQVEKQVQQYEEQIKQYMLQYQQYEQMFINLQSLGNVIPSFDNNLQHLDANQLAQIECNSSNGTWSVGTIVQSVASSFDKTYVEAQKEICTQVVTIQVDKYNKTADMMGRMNYYNKLAQQTDQTRTGINQQSGTGDLNSNTNQAARNLADLQTEIANWQSQMAADDSMLKTLQDMQSVLADAALRGSQDMLGKGVQAAALATALQIND